MCRLKNFLPEDVLLTLYNALVLPHLNYGILLWGHKVEKLSKIQKKTMRIITSSNYNCHTEPLFKRMKVLKATHLCSLHELNFCYKLENDLLPPYFLNYMFNKHSTIHRHNTRHTNNFQIPQVRHVFAQNCLRFRIPSIFNSTPSAIIDKIYTHSKSGFSKYVKHYYLNSYKNVCDIRNCYSCRMITNR